MKSKISKIVIVVVILLLVVACVFFLIQQNQLKKQISQKDTLLQAKESELEKANKTISVLQYQNGSSQNGTSLGNGNTSQTTSYQFIPLDTSKMLNGKTGANYQVAIENEELGIQLVLQEEGTVTLTFTDEDVLEDITQNSKVTVGKEIHLTGFSTKVKDFLCIPNEEEQKTLLIFLVEDGTLEYISLQSIVEEGKFTSLGKIIEIKNVVKLMSGINANESKQQIPLAITQTGSCYDVNKILEEMKIF